MLVSLIATATTGAADIEWSVQALSARVATLQHPLSGHQPIHAWSLPDVPQTDVAVGLRQSGVLSSNVRLLWSRGVAPTVNLAAVSQGDAFATMDGALALAATLNDLNVPVHVFANPPLWMSNWSVLPTGEARHFPWDFWPSGSERWFRYSINFDGELWPVLPLASPDSGYIAFRQLLDRFRSGNGSRHLPGVASIAALWIDYEDLPHPWNGTRESQLLGRIGARPVASFYESKTVRFPGNARSVRDVYGPDVLTSPQTFTKYCADLRTWLIAESMQRALGEVYGPRTLAGGYGDIYSSASSPFVDLNDSVYPVAIAPPVGMVAMPAVYANNRYPRKYLGAKGQPAATQRNADHVYWHLMLKSFSSSAANGPRTAKSVPWVSQYIREDLSGAFDFAMSSELYKELLRHLWLRGAQGMYVFNPYDSKAKQSGVYMTASYSLNQLAYVTEVFDEMLAYPEFLAHGVPMTFEWRGMFDEGVIWSGLALDGDALVRLTSRSNTDAVVNEIAVPGGATFRLLTAPPQGATYLLRKDGTSTRLSVPIAPRLNIAKELMH